MSHFVPGHHPAEEGAGDRTPPTRSPEIRRMERLGDEIASLDANVYAAIHEILVRTGEFDALFERYGGSSGFRSAADWLAWRTGMSRTAARERLRVARALPDLPLVSKAMSRGELSFSKVRAIVRAAPMERETEEKLLEFALSGTACHLERLVRSWRRLGKVEEVPEERARHEERHLHLRPDDDGSWVVRGRLDPEVGALLDKALEMGVETLYRSERRGGGRDPAAAPPYAGQRRADALRLVVEAALRFGCREKEVTERHGGRNPEAVPARRRSRDPSDASEASRDDSAGLRDRTRDDSAESPRDVSDDDGPEPRREAGEHDSGESRAPRRLSPDTSGDRFQVVLHVDLGTLREEAGGQTNVRESAGQGGTEESDTAAPDTAAPETAATETAATETAATETAEPDAASRRSSRLSPARFAFLDPHLRVAAETARRLSCDSARVIMIRDEKAGILNVGRRTRTVPPALARAVSFRDGGRCRFPGCSAPGRDRHHVEHWADGGETKLENLALLCWFHHRAVHEGGFTVESDGDGGFRFRRPDGRIIPPAPRLPTSPGDPVARLKARVRQVHEAEPDGHEIGPWTATPDWDGRPPDLNWMLSSLPPFGGKLEEGDAPGRA